MPASSIVTFKPTGLNGKTLAQAMSEITDRIADPKHAPETLEDTLTQLGYTDTFGRDALLRAYRPTLRDGGENFHLTQRKRWLFRTEKWAEALGVQRGKNVARFERTTEHTSQLAEAIKNANGAVSEMTSEAVMSILATMNDRAGKKLDVASLQYLVEDVGTVVSDNKQLQNEIQVHRGYKEVFDKTTAMLERQLALMERLVDDRGTSTSPTRSRET